MRRRGWSVLVVPEWEYVPVKWQGTVMRAAGRGLRSLAVREFNRALQAAVDDHQPAFLLVFKGTFVKPDTLSLLRSRKVPAYCFFPDVSTRAHGPYIPRALPLYDMVFTTKSFGLSDMQSLGVRNATLLLHAFDSDLHRPTPLNAEDHGRYDCDVSFIGTWSPKKEKVLAAVKETLPDVHLRIWGAQWSKTSNSILHSSIQGRAIHGLEYVKAIGASTINLAILSERRPGASSGDLITSRTFHIPASGGFMLHERTDEVLSIFAENKSVACFSDVDELAMKIRHYLDVPEQRNAIADCGRRAVESSHSWDHRIQEILSYHESQT